MLIKHQGVGDKHIGTQITSAVIDDPIPKPAKHPHTSQGIAIPKHAPAELKSPVVIVPLRPKQAEQPKGPAAICFVSKQTIRSIGKKEDFILETSIK